MTSTVGAVAAAITAAIGLLVWILNRRNHATPEQKIDDRRAELDSLQCEITAARARGDDAHAESLLRRLGELQNPGSNPAGDSPGAAGELGDRDPASGHRDPSA